MAWMQFINAATFPSAPSLVLTLSWRQVTEVGFSICGIPSGLPRTYVICLGQHEAWSKARRCAAWLKDHVKPSNLPMALTLNLSQSLLSRGHRLWHRQTKSTPEECDLEPTADQKKKGIFSTIRPVIRPAPQHCPRHRHPQCSAQRF